MMPTMSSMEQSDLNGFSDEGATAVEYAIIASLIAAVIAFVVGLLGLEVLGLFTSVIDLWP